MDQFFKNQYSRQVNPTQSKLLNKTVEVGKTVGHTVTVLSLLGEGGYAKIYSCVNDRSRKAYALKHFILQGRKDLIAAVKYEAQLMVKLRNHPNILTLHAASFMMENYGGAQRESDGFFLLDLAIKDLVAHLRQQRNGRLESKDEILDIFGQVCRAIGHLHKQMPPLAHRDLKAENILLLPDGRWVLCDFGSASVESFQLKSGEDRYKVAKVQEIMHATTTPAYRSPEMWDIMQRKVIDTKVDIWALGCLLYLMCEGQLPFAGANGRLSVLSGRYPEPQNTDEELKVLISRLLVVDPADRPDIRAVKRYADGIRKGLTVKAVEEMVDEQLRQQDQVAYVDGQVQDHTQEQEMINLDTFEVGSKYDGNIIKQQQVPTIQSKSRTWCPSPVSYEQVLPTANPVSVFADNSAQNASKQASNQAELHMTTNSNNPKQADQQQLQKASQNALTWKKNSFLQNINGGVVPVQHGVHALNKVKSLSAKNSLRRQISHQQNRSVDDSKVNPELKRSSNESRSKFGKGPESKGYDFEDLVQQQMAQSNEKQTSKQESWDPFNEAVLGSQDLNQNVTNPINNVQHRQIASPSQQVNQVDEVIYKQEQVSKEFMQVKMQTPNVHSNSEQKIFTKDTQVSLLQSQADQSQQLVQPGQQLYQGEGFTNLPQGPLQQQQQQQQLQEWDPFIENSSPEGMAVQNTLHRESVYCTDQGQQAYSVIQAENSSRVIELEQINMQLQQRYEDQVNETLQLREEVTRLKLQLQNQNANAPEAGGDRVQRQKTVSEPPPFDFENWQWRND